MDTCSNKNGHKHGDIGYKDDNHSLYVPVFMYSIYQTT